MTPVHPSDVLGDDVAASYELMDAQSAVAMLQAENDSLRVKLNTFEVARYAMQHRVTQLDALIAEVPYQWRITERDGLQNALDMLGDMPDEAISVETSPEHIAGTPEFKQYTELLQRYVSLYDAVRAYLGAPVGQADVTALRALVGEEGK